MKELRYWKVVNLLQKVYMTIATIVLIGITSMGIFGFLSNSYMGATTEFETMTTKLSVYKDQLEVLEEDKVFLKEREIFDFLGYQYLNPEDRVQ